MLVVRAYHLNKEEIGEDDIKLSGKCLIGFHADIGKLYGNRHYAYNSHQHKHLELFIRRYEPLWATSASMLENQSGVIAYSVNGKKNIGKEIINKIKLQVMYQLLRSNFPNDFLNNIRSKSNNILPIKNVKDILNLNQLENVKYFCAGSHFDTFDTTHFETIYYTSEIYVKKS